MTSLARVVMCSRRSALIMCTFERYLRLDGNTHDVVFELRSDRDDFPSFLFDALNNHPWLIAVDDKHWRLSLLV